MAYLVWIRVPLFTPVDCVWHFRHDLAERRVAPRIITTWKIGQVTNCKAKKKVDYVTDWGKERFLPSTFFTNNYKTTIHQFFSHGLSYHCTCTHALFYGLWSLEFQFDDKGYPLEGSMFDVYLCKYLQATGLRKLKPHTPQPLRYFPTTLRKVEHSALLPDCTSPCQDELLCELR